jgi:hypothetical protein
MFWYWPASQVEHAEADELECFPAWQIEHDVADEMEYLPPGQAGHVDPVVAE